ncbi:MAG TPA: Tex family protein [Steroidobacteraceae bacterium]|nr:Tex family protein [Steroidobacteraceae bacterium]
MPALPSIESRIATELSCRPQQVAAAVALLDEGATVPFIARYRKEVTDNLDDTQLRTLLERLTYLRELEERRTAILKSIDEQQKMTPALKASIESADSKQRLEDLYLPYKPKRRTKAQIAKEAGLDVLAQSLLTNPALNPEAEAVKYLREPFEFGPDKDKNPGVPDVKAALDGARQILMEQFAEDAELLGQLRTYLTDHAVLVSIVVEGKEAEGAKFRDYFNYQEPLQNVPSHRALALFRGRKEEFLRVTLKLPEELNAAAGTPLPPNACELKIAARYQVADKGRAADAWLQQTVRWTWSIKVAWSLESELFSHLREQAEEEAIRVFARNLHDLLLAAPAGPRITMGLDPGIRTGVKVAVVDSTGKVLESSTVYPHEPRNDWNGSLVVLGRLVKQHKVDLIAIGNGTASRETDKLAGELIKLVAEHFGGQSVTKIVVSEAGASVYSASELASKELPGMDVSIRGAVSIARRLQDPLAELVKIDPKSIGVGQYQHDVNQTKLAKQLDAIVEDCVNAVGVDVNTASPALLARISGLSSVLAENIVSYRDQNGAFASRQALKKVPRLGAKTFEQAAGFLRVMNGEDPLDASAVHPESYVVVQRILDDLKRGARELLGDGATLRKLEPKKYVDDTFGLPTVRDILTELEKPGRDPRPEFKTATFQDGVNELKDLKPGMLLEGVVTNVANFGAFVDIGVHQDGLVHISMLSNKFVKDPREVVKAGDVVRVKVLEIDVARKRVALTMRLDDATPRSTGERRPTQDAPRRSNASPAKHQPKPEPQGNGMMADALAAALKGRSK